MGSSIEIGNLKKAEGNIAFDFMHVSNSGTAWSIIGTNVRLQCVVTMQKYTDILWSSNNEHLKPERCTYIMRDGNNIGYK